MSQRYPNANYPEAYDEADMVKATDVSANADGGALTVTEVSAPYGPLMEHAVTGKEIKGVSFRDGGSTVKKSAPAPAEESATEEDV